jgi:uncharacterized protein DUF2442
MHRVKNVSAGQGYTLEIEFTDGVQGTVDVSQRLFGPMFEPLRDRALFQQVKVDEFGAVFWPNGADLAPDALYLKLANQQPSEALTK